MKNITKIALGFILISVITLTSCKKWIDTDINVDPNNPTDVPISLLLPSVQSEMAYTLMGNDGVRITNMWLQYFNGSSRQSLTQGRYVWKSSDVNNLWGSAYQSNLMDLKQMMDKAEANNSPHYAGVAKVLTAWDLGYLTDLFGDIPYSDAFQGNAQLTPKYDTQETIYATIQSLLDAAITDLAATESVESPGDEDIFYGGNLSNWTKLAWSLKARYALNLSAVNGNQAYTDALTYAANGFTSNADNMQFTFTASAKSPLFQFMDQRGDITMASTFIDMLNADADNRILEYSADGAASVGGEPGTNEEEGISAPGDFVAADVATVYLMTYHELKFIEAEANFELGNVSTADTAYLDGAVASNLLVLAQSYFDANGVALTPDIIKTWPWYGTINVGDGSIDLETIMKQKYIADFGTVQTYSDWRRTGYPVLLPAANTTADIPRRFPYPQDELDYNTSNVPSVTLSDNVWWNQ